MVKKALAIITARGGSKRIPRKNIKLFLGKPIIKYSIDTALKAKCFDEVMVSTDDKEIAKISKKFGAKIPFYRSLKNSDDNATTSDVIKEVLSEYKKRGIHFEYFCCIYPAAPFITKEKIKKSFKQIQESGVDSIFPVVRLEFPIQRSLSIKDGKLKRIYPEHEKSRSQDLTPIYNDCAQFYWVKTKSFLKHGGILTNNTIGLETSKLEMQDIDCPEDWKLAEIKYELIHRTK